MTIKNLDTRYLQLPDDVTSFLDAELEYDNQSRPVICAQAVLKDTHHTKVAVLYAVYRPFLREVGRVPAIYGPPHLVKHPDGHLIVYGKTLTVRELALADVPSLDEAYP